MPSRRRRRASAIAMLALLLAAATPVHAADNGTVTATVTADGGACIVVSGSLSYGTLPFRTADEAPILSPSAPVPITNCDTLANADLFVRGTPAVNANNTVAWTLGPPEEVACPGFGLDRYLHVVYPVPYTEGSERALSDVDQTFGSVAVNGQTRLHGEIAMPCVGSNGAGQTMTFSVLVTATKGA